MPSSSLRILWAVVCLVMLLPLPARAADRVTVAWDASADPNVTGYTLHLGTRSRQYTNRIEVGAQTLFLLPLLPQGTYFVAVRAYTADGVTSDFSNELRVNVPGTAEGLKERTRTDFNGDGFGDILWSNRTTGQMATWLMSGEAVKAEAGLSHSMPDLNWEVAGTGDFNGDTRPDILWRHKLYGFVGVWFMNGLTCIGVVNLSTPRVDDTAWKIAAVGDVTGDGKADIVWQHDTGPLALWRMNGTTNMAGSALVGDPAMAYDPRWRVVGIADMNGDKQMDLLWQHEAGWLSAWLMYAGNVFGVQSLNPVAEFDTAWRVVGVLDANLDDKPDILWQHATSGDLALWYMDGLTRTGTVNVVGGSIGAPQWKVVGPR